MSQFEPCRIPACIAPVCEDQSHSHSIIEWEPLRSQAAIVGALPSRNARTSTSVREPVDLEEQHPWNVARRRGVLRVRRVPLDHLAVVEVVVVDPRNKRHHVGRTSVRPIATIDRRHNPPI